jgi:hypothetical protein
LGTEYYLRYYVKNGEELEQGLFPQQTHPPISSKMNLKQFFHHDVSFVDKKLFVYVFGVLTQELAMGQTLFLDPACVTS